MKPLSPSNFSNNLNTSKGFNSNKVTLKSLKLPDSQPSSNKDIFLGQASPKVTSLAHIQLDNTQQNKTNTRQAGARGSGDITGSSKQNTQTSIKDLISEPKKQTIEVQDIRNNYFRSDTNIKPDQNHEKSVRQIIDEKFGTIRQEVSQGNEQQMRQIQEKAVIYSK